MGWVSRRVSRPDPRSLGGAWVALGWRVGRMSDDDEDILGSAAGALERPARLRVEDMSSDDELDASGIPLVHLRNAAAEAQRKSSSSSGAVATGYHHATQGDKAIDISASTAGIGSWSSSTTSNSCRRCTGFISRCGVSHPKVCGAGRSTPMRRSSPLQLPSERVRSSGRRRRFAASRPWPRTAALHTSGVEAKATRAPAARLMKAAGLRQGRRGAAAWAAPGTTTTPRPWAAATTKTGSGKGVVRRGGESQVRERPSGA